jgi:tRNA pseudouridine38-40 synthase
MRRARMTIAYRGDQFSGFATNPGMHTVASTIEAALQQVMQQEVKVIPAGRTDAGVHAWGQVISLDLPETIDIDLLAKQMNALCGPAIVVREARWAQPDFHARFSALWRTYRYTILNSPVPNPFLVDTAWHISRPLNVRAMQLASDALIGEHDFSAFCRKPKLPEGDERSMRRYVLAAKWTPLDDGMVRFEITANAFCHQMVRSIVGTLADIGMGKRPPSDVRGLILAGDRREAAHLAPPQGLSLWEVGYPVEPE